MRGPHSATAMGDDTLKGLLADQEAALEMVFATVKDDQPLSHHAVKSWHQLLTRHQSGAASRDIDGRRMEIPLLKGEYKLRPNNPRRPDGVVHEYCPPEQVRSKMDRFFTLHEAHRERRLPTEVEAAWLHRAFVRTHPFQDGNGRVSRLLMAYAFVRQGEFPPIITAGNKDEYIDCLDEADRGNLRDFIGYLARLSSQSTARAVQIGNRILDDRDRMHHANGGITVNGDYHPPFPEEPTDPRPGLRPGVCGKRKLHHRRRALVNQGTQRLDLAPVRLAHRLQAVVRIASGPQECRFPAAMRQVPARMLHRVRR